jgi:hypothetical protein
MKNYKPLLFIIMVCLALVSLPLIKITNKSEAQPIQQPLQDTELIYRNKLSERGAPCEYSVVKTERGLYIATCFCNEYESAPISCGISVTR